MRQSLKGALWCVLMVCVAHGPLHAQTAPAKDGAPAKAAKDKADGKAKAEGETAPEAPPKLNVYAEMAKANKLANAGAYSRAVPAYERVLAADPDNYSVAHFNLGEIYKLRNKCVQAAFHYQAYLATGRDEPTLKYARSGLRQCLQPTSPALSVKLAPADGEIYINGFLFARGELKATQLPVGEYKVEVRAEDHGAQVREVRLKEQEPQQLDFTLERFTFFGMLKVEVDQPGATIRVTPKALDKADETAQVQSVASPMAEPLKLATGKYFVEIEREGFDRWIRNVQVTREGTTLVEAKLNKQVPEEIR